MIGRSNACLSRLIPTPKYPNTYSQSASRSSRRRRVISTCLSSYASGNVSKTICPAFCPINWRWFVLFSATSGIDSTISPDIVGTWPSAFREGIRGISPFFTRRIPRRSIDLSIATPVSVVPRRSSLCIVIGPLAYI